METLLRPLDGKESRQFVICLAVSLVAHLLLAALIGGFGGGGGGDSDTEVAASRLAERFAQAVNAATELDAQHRERLQAAFAEVDKDGWKREEMPETLQWLADGAGLAVEESDLVRALDSARSREGRFDIRMWLRWGQSNGARQILMLAYLVGEGTLQSNFGSHRLWLHLEADDGAGRIAFETMDCRQYRSGKISGVDLLHRARWSE